MDFCFQLFFRALIYKRFLCFAQETYHIFGIDAAGDGHTPPWTYNYGVSVNEL